MNKISFFTPVCYNPSSTFTQSILECVDSYFHLGGMKAQAHSNFTKGSATRVFLENVECSFLMTALKVASYFTLILPLIMLVAKVILRCSHDFYLMSDWDREMSSKAEMIHGDPDTATIYFFGDTHSEEWHPKFQGEIINHYVKEGDVFLIEGTQSLKSLEDHVKELGCEGGAQYFRRGFGIQKKVEIFGWDDEQKVKKQLNFALGAIEATSTAEKEKLNLERDKLTVDRNQDMIKTINYFREKHPEKKIFVKAGARHMVDGKRDYSIIDHFKSERCFLILPKVNGSYTLADDEQYVRKQCQLSNRISNRKFA